MAAPVRAWQSPPAGPPRELWRTPVAHDGPLYSVTVSVDGSIWTTEFHRDGTALRHRFTIAVYEHDGSLRWRSHLLCDTSPLIAVAPDGNVIVVGERDVDEYTHATDRSVVFRLSPHGELLDSWAVPDQPIGLFGVRNGPILYAGLFRDGILASCRGQRPLWVRTIAETSPTNPLCGLGTGALAQPDGTVWASPGKGADPIRLGTDGNILEALPRSKPEAYKPSAGVVATMDARTVLVNERAGCESQAYSRAVLWENGAIAVQLQLMGDDAYAQGFLLAPDLSIWSTSEGKSMQRFVNGTQSWKRGDLTPDADALYPWAADSSLLATFYDAPRKTSYLARVRSDGSLAWKYDLVGGDGVADDSFYWHPFMVAPDGVVYIAYRGQVIAIQTDFAPVRRPGDFVLQNVYD